MNDSTTRAGVASRDGVPADDILVWDAPVRLSHWLMAASFAGAYLTAESEAWRGVHVTLGFTMAALAVFRVAWGVVGTRYARFSNFVRGPRTVFRYIGALLRGRPEHYIGHTPAGAVAILSLLTLTLLVAASGWATYREVSGEQMEDLHEVLANVMLAVVAIHIVAVLVTSRMHHENLVMAMINGRKHGRPEDGVPATSRSVAALMLIGVLGYWGLEWRTLPGKAGEHPAGEARVGEHDDN